MQSSRTNTLYVISSEAMGSWISSVFKFSQKKKKHIAVVCLNITYSIFGMDNCTHQLGLDNAGKSTILSKLGKITTTIVTIGPSSLSL
jgi:hypothetical protein